MDMDIIEYFHTSVASINMGIFGGRNHKTDRNLQLTLNIQHFPSFFEVFKIPQFNLMAIYCS